MHEFGAYGSPPGSGNAYSRAMLQQLLPIAEGPWRIGADSVPILLAPAHGVVASIEQPLGAYRVHRPANDGGLVFNNSPSGLRAEFERIMAGKREVLAGLARVGQPRMAPLWLAPWEVRTLALCRRFGGLELREHIKGLPDGNLGYLLRSIWRWPVRPLAAQARPLFLGARGGVGASAACIARCTATSTCGRSAGGGARPSYFRIEGTCRHSRLQSSGHRLNRPVARLIESQPRSFRMRARRRIALRRRHLRVPA